MTRPEPGLTYEAAGVSIAANDDAVERLRSHVRSTHRPEVIGDLGSFGGLFAFAGSRYDDPVLVSSTDGVGTKSLVASALRRYDTIGIDLVAMSVDDIAVQGAEPLFFLDYVSLGRNDPVMVEQIVAGVAAGCRQAGAALLGGEISEHPGLFPDGGFDLVGFAVGVVERAALLPKGVAPGDALIGIASPGLRSNGYTLARHALLDVAGRDLAEPAWPGSARTLGDELLEPSVIYAPALRSLRTVVDVHALAHITGGGIAGNLARVLPPTCDAVVTAGTWDEPRIFSVVEQAGPVTRREMERVFNLGIGMIAVIDARDASDAIEHLASVGHRAWSIGTVVAGSGRVSVVPRPG
jgi:phosphoribosylformylglycinamidine cyclo-ligase